LVVLLVSAASFWMKPRYEAVARIVFNRESSNPLGFKDLGDMPRDDAEYAVSLDTQVQILQSDTLAEQVIRDLHLDQSPAFVGKRASPQPDTQRAQAALLRLFKAGLAIAKEKNTRVIQIRYKSTDPKLSADIANTLTQAYIEHNFKMRFQSTTLTAKWLTQQLTELANKVEDSQRSLVDYQKNHGFFEVDDKQNMVTTRLDDLNRELTVAQADRISKEANYRLTLAENAELAAKAEPNALIDRLNAQEAALKNQYAQATVQLGPSNPKVQELSNQLKETQDEINVERHKMSEKARTQYFEALARERMIRAAVEEQKQQANKLSETAIEYGLLKRDAESNRQLYEGLLQKLKEAGVSAGMRSSNIEVVDVAEVPTAPTEPNIPRNLVIAALLGVVGGIGLAFIQEKLDRTVRTFQQLQALSSLPQLGIIPLVSGNGSQLAASPTLSLGSSASTGRSVDLVASWAPVSPIAGSYRALVNSILFSAQVPPKVILLTSAITGDGKTAVSINVAIVFARQGKRVLLVDADLRRPSIHQALQLPAAEGLSTMLRDRDKRSKSRSGLGSESVSDPLPSPGVPNLFVMPAGPLHEESDELVGSKAMLDLLQQWKTQFDHIIIDTSPVVLVPDIVRLSVSTDSVILVVRWGHTPQAAFARAQQLLTQVNAPLMGVVLNGTDTSSPALSYYGRYGYSSYPGPSTRPQ
jgi:capsular exopolysaccharide synthesis family protein